MPIQKANLTLAIDDALLQRARAAALGENTTVNALVREFLGRYVHARSRRLKVRNGLISKVKLQLLVCLRASGWLSATGWLRIQKAQLPTLKKSPGSCERCPLSDQLP